MINVSSEKHFQLKDNEHFSAFLTLIAFHFKSTDVSLVFELSFFFKKISSIFMDLISFFNILKNFKFLNNSQQ